MIMSLRSILSLACNLVRMVVGVLCGQCNIMCSSEPSGESAGGAVRPQVLLGVMQ
jgi:hypothetical protein